jgi:methylthioribose-1-phosphate isomerase
MLPKSIEWIKEEHVLRLLDQRLIPHAIAYRDCSSYEEVALSIEDMTVRGAPAIGSVAAYGTVLAALAGGRDLFDEAIKRLVVTRPTAVNLFWALERMKNCAAAYNNESAGLAAALENEAENIRKEDIEINKKLSSFGEKLLPNEASVITHCNAGALATCGYGTALGILRSARENGKKIKIYADETRPRCQGARLTAFELLQDGFDVTLICDSMAAFLMSRKKIDAVITGADRVAINGDTANKIGTYSLAIAAKEHGVPFYVAAPLSTIDEKCIDGNEITIEERSADEVRCIDGSLIAPEDVPVWNPAFDVTPARLIKGIITENGVLSYPYNLADLKNGNDKR